MPASSANLGPGFDALGLALDIYLECRFRRSDALSIRVSGQDADLIPSDETNLIWRAAQSIAAAHRRALPPAEIQVHNEIPLGKGLGSSAAALTAGVVLGQFLLGLDWTRERVLRETAKLEGHPDNAAACALGGVVVSSLDEWGDACAIRLDLPAACALAIAIPEYALPTAESRAALPREYSREDVVFNLQRTALLVAALATGNVERLRVALADRIHQPFRARLVPGAGELLALRSPGLYGCVLSGAGPSVLFLFERDHREALAAVEESVKRFPGSSLREVSVCPHGYQVLADTGGD